MLLSAAGTVTSTVRVSLTATSRPSASMPATTTFCSPMAAGGTSTSNCASGPGCSASCISLPGWLISRMTVAISGAPVTSTCNDSPAVTLVPGAGLVIVISGATALAPSRCARRRSGQDSEGVE